MVKMTSLWALALVVTCFHYVIAQDIVRPCRAEGKVNSSAVSCQTDDQCSASLICCTYQGSGKCVQPLIPNYQATLYILGLPRITDEGTHLTNFMRKHLGNVSSFTDLEIERLGQCVHVYINLHTEKEDAVDIILEDMEQTPVSIDHFSGGPFTVTSVKNETVCQKVVEIPNYNAVLYVVGVPTSVTADMIRTKMMGVLKGVGHSWDFQSQKKGGCLEVHLDGVLTEEQDIKASEELDRLEEEGLTMKADGSYLRIVSNRQEADEICPSMTGNNTMPIAIPNYQAQFLILNVVGVASFGKVKDALLDTVRPFGFRWQINSMTVGGCMDVHLDGVVKEEKEEGLSIALDDLEEKGLNVTSSRRVFNVTSRKTDMTSLCKKMTRPDNDTRLQINVTLKAPWYGRYSDIAHPVMESLIIEMTPSFKTLKGFKKLTLLKATPATHVIVEASFSQNVSLTEVQKLMTLARGRQIPFDGEQRKIHNVTLVTSGKCGGKGCGKGGTCAQATSGAHCLCSDGFSGDRCQQHSGHGKSHHDVKCGQTEMSFSIPISDLKFVPQNVTLSDPRCHVRISANHLTGTTPLNACGTSLRLTNESLVFSNFLLFPPAAAAAPAPAKATDGGGSSNVTTTTTTTTNNNNIERIIPIECHYKRVSELRLSFLPMVRQILFTETGVGQFQFRIEQFQDAAYSSKVAESAYPLKVTASKRVYLQLSLGKWVLRGKGGYGMEVEKCVASSSPSMMATHNDSSKDLIRNSCPVKPEVQLIHNPSSSSSSPEEDTAEAETTTTNTSGAQDHFRFSFKPPALSNSSSDSGQSTSTMTLMYVHCRVRLCAQESCPSPEDCDSGSSSSSSSEGHPDRRKRDLRPWGTSLQWPENHHLSTGPFLITESVDTPKSSAATLTTPLVVALAALAGTTTVMALGVMAAWAFSRRRSDRYELSEGGSRRH